VDINPVAELITRVKTHPINPKVLHEIVNNFLISFQSYREEDYLKIQAHERLDYWFSSAHKGKIAFLYEKIDDIEDVYIKNFLLVALSNILKNSSKWLQSSTKPQVDPKKIPSDPFVAIQVQLKQMLRKNTDFFNALSTS
jgi:hypothetical protein